MTQTGTSADDGNVTRHGKEEVRPKKGGRRASLTSVDFVGEGAPRSAGHAAPRASRASGSRERVPRAAGRADVLGPSVRVDSARAALLPYAAPVADWLLFLAERLAAEYLREMTRQDTAP
jgi:hypothetical protein